MKCCTYGNSVRERDCTCSEKYAISNMSREFFLTPPTKNVTMFTNRKGVYSSDLTLSMICPVASEKEVVFPPLS